MRIILIQFYCKISVDRAVEQSMHWLVKDTESAHGVLGGHSGSSTDRVDQELSKVATHPAHQSRETWRSERSILRGMITCVSFRHKLYQLSSRWSRE
jgi:hypothetical protein